MKGDKTKQDKPEAERNLETLLPYKFARPGLMIFDQNSQSVLVA